MKRKEFSRKVRIAALDRAAGHCEDCSAPLMPGRYVYDHVITDWMGGEATLENCRVRCRSCDAPKTAKDQKTIAKVKRIRDRFTGALVKVRRFRGWRNFRGELVMARDRR